MTATNSPRFFWYAGLVLLFGTLLGASFVFNNGVKGTGQAASPDKSEAMPVGVISIGLVDTRDGVSGLYPVQPGRVAEVRDEGFVAKKGDWLLRLDHRFAELKLREARADRDAAKAVLRQAEKLPEQHVRQMEQQKAAVAAARFLKAAKEAEKKKATKAHDDKLIADSDLAAITQTVNALDSALQLQEIKLQELSLQDPTVKLNQAQADLAAKQARLEEADLALLECDILAPSDGMLLRVLAHQGETLGNNPKQPALQFLPEGPIIIRAEVQQEWANRVQPGQQVSIEDDTSTGAQKPVIGKVKRMSDWFANRRYTVIEPFMFNDVRTLECIIEVTDQKSPFRIGQRVRVHIHTGS